MNKYIFLLLAMLGSISSFAQTSEENISWEQIKKEVVELKTFHIEINQAIPRRGRSIHSSNHFLSIQNDSLISALPYYGRATNIAYGGGDGLSFQAPLKTYQVDQSKAKELNISFKVSSPDDYYEYQLTIFPNKKVSLQVIGVNRDPISFLGDYVSKAKEK